MNVGALYDAVLLTFFSHFLGIFHSVSGGVRELGSAISVALLAHAEIVIKHLIIQIALF